MNKRTQLLVNLIQVIFIIVGFLMALYLFHLLGIF